MVVDELVIGDDASAWATLGFAVDGGWAEVGGVQLRFDPDAGERIRSWTLRGGDGGAVVDGTIDGLPTVVAVGEPRGHRADPGADHPNGVRAIDHIVVLSPDVDRTAAALEAVGIVRRRTRHVGPEQYGFAARQTFFRLGEVIVELIGPDEPSGDERPARFYGLAFTVADLDALAAELGPRLGRVKEAVQPGRRIATLRHRDAGVSVAVAFMSPGPGAV